MSITVTAEPDFFPPRVKVEVAAPSGSTFTAISVYRVVSGVRTLVRQQPSAGFSTALTYDYECERNTTVTYEADYTSAAEVATAVWSEDWSTGWDTRWSGDTGSFSPSAGMLYATAAYKTITQFGLPSSVSRLFVDNLAFTGQVRLWQAGDDDNMDITAGVDADSTQLTVHWTQAGASGQIVVPSAPDADVVFASTSTLVNGVSFPYVLDALYRLDFRSNYAPDSPGQVGEMTLYGNDVPADAVETSSLVTLSVTDGWIIHPAVPAKSFKLSITDARVAGIREIGDVGNKATSTVHQILGQALPIVSWSSPRAEDDMTLSVAIATRAEERALKACLADQVPVLIRIPASAGIGWDDGFFSVGDVNRTRLGQLPNFELRTVDLPLTRTQSPVVTQENAGWSYAAVAATYTSYVQVRAAYATYADEAVDNRNAGF